MEPTTYPHHHSGSFAIYAEFARDYNKPMKNGLNRRLFNVTEAHQGPDIQQEPDGSIRLQPGVYHITGFSCVTMQVTMAPPVIDYNTNYPGYCLLYPREYENDNPLNHQLSIGSLSLANVTTPSLFDFVLPLKEEMYLCLGHQSGEQLNDEVYLSIYEVGSVASPYHVFARIAIFKL